MGSSKKLSKRKPQPQMRSRNTRSSKGRLLQAADPEICGRLLDDQLRSLGLYAAQTVGDGNCLFRALSDQLYGSPSRHTELRARICDWIERHRDRYEPFVEDERGIETHMRCMRENGTYGGHLELSAFSHLTRRNVKVVQPGLVHVIEWAAFWSPATSPTTSSQPSISHDHGYDHNGGEIHLDGDSNNYNQCNDYDNDPTTTPLSARDKRHLRRSLERDRREQGRGKGKGKLVKLSLEIKSAVNDGVGGLDSGPIYVAYHDWEHFSSIRNLKGPHSGLPCVIETSPPGQGLEEGKNLQIRGNRYGRNFRIGMDDDSDVVKGEEVRTVTGATAVIQITTNTTTVLAENVATLGTLTAVVPGAELSLVRARKGVDLDVLLPVSAAREEPVLVIEKDWDT